MTVQVNGVVISTEERPSELSRVYNKNTGETGTLLKWSLNKATAVVILDNTLKRIWRADNVGRLDK